MIIIFGILIFCHLLADFVLPIRHLSIKGFSVIFYSLIHALLVYACLSWGEWLILDRQTLIYCVVIFTEYLVFCSIRPTLHKNYSNHKVFLIEQVYHFVIFFIIAYLWRHEAILLNSRFAVSIIAILIGVIGISQFSITLMDLITKDFVSKNADLKFDIESGLVSGGKYIGILERSLIFIFILMNQMVAIGFLIAAKSLLRLDSDPKHHKRMEYILVGTFFSFLLAVLFALLTKLLLLKGGVLS